MQRAEQLKILRKKLYGDKLDYPLCGATCSFYIYIYSIIYSAWAGSHQVRFARSKIHI